MDVGQLGIVHRYYNVYRHNGTWYYKPLAWGHISCYSEGFAAIEDALAAAFFDWTELLTAAEQDAMTADAAAREARSG